MINGRTEVRHLNSWQKAMNGFFRFKYATFLEFFICILINLHGVSNFATFSPNG